jgi:uncharacterized protein
MTATALRIIACLVLALVAPAIALAAPVETEIEAPGPNGPLKGLMLSPGKSAAPVVLIIPGSGPVDRDGNSLHGLNTDTYKLLAQGLADRDIASVRVDKRGFMSSGTAIPNSNNVTIADYATDVHSWAAVILKQAGGKCIWVLGHGEGGLVGMVAAKDKPPDICGLLLVATAGRPFASLIKDQLRSNPANAAIQDEAFHDLDELAAGRKVDVSNTRPEITAIFPPAVQGFLIDLFSYDPPKVLASYKGPVLILQGEHDVEIGIDDARLLAAADPQAKLVVLPNVNHVLKTVNSENRNYNLKTYFDPKLPIAPGVIEALSEFIGSKP